jgi:hypothetical protein
MNGLATEEGGGWIEHLLSWTTSPSVALLDNAPSSPIPMLSRKGWGTELIYIVKALLGIVGQSRLPKKDRKEF